MNTTHTNRSLARITLAAAVFILTLIAIIPAARAADLTATPASTTITLDGTLRKVEIALAVTDTPQQVRVPAPHVARTGSQSFDYRPLAELEALKVKLEQTRFDLQPGTPQKMRVQIRQAASLLAGRYKLRFSIVDAQGKEPLTSATVIVIVPVRVCVGPPVVQQMDTRSDTGRVSALVRFDVSSNVQNLQLQVEASSLASTESDDYQLKPDADRPIEISARRAEIGGRALERAALKPGGGKGTWRSQTVAMEHRRFGGVNDQVYVRVWWKRPDRRATPAGHYKGHVRLLVMPEARTPP